MNKARRFVHNWPTVAVLVIIIGGVSLALWRTQDLYSAQLDEKQARIDESARTIDQICESDSQLRQAVIDYVKIQTTPVPDDPNADAGTRARIAAANRQRADAAKVTADFFAPSPCADGKLPVSKVPVGTTTTTGG